MKKKMSLLIAAVLTVSALTLSSCGKSDKEVLKEYTELCEKSYEAYQKGDLEKANKLKKEATEYAEKHAKQLEKALKAAFEGDD